MAERTTQLDAVNVILSNIGQAPVTGLGTGNPQVEMAQLILEEVSRAIQDEGWTFNTERQYPFERGNWNGMRVIEIPENVLHIDLAPYSHDEVVVREGRLYNKTTHSYDWDKDLTLDVVWLFDFKDLPEAFKNYITIRAANLFAGRSVGSKEAVKFGEMEEKMARAAVMEYETQQCDYSFFNNYDYSNTYRGYQPVNTLYRF